MYKPQTDTLTAGTAGIETFLGYNHNLRIGSGEFYDMENLTSDNYPVLTPRKPRGRYCRRDQNGNLPENVIGACYNDGIYYVTSDGNLVTPEGKVIYLGIGNAGRRTLICNGAYILIFPDKIYYNITDPDDHGSMEMNETFKDVQIYPYDQERKKYYMVYKDFATDDGLVLTRQENGEVLAELATKVYGDSADEEDKIQLIPTNSIHLCIWLPTNAKIDVKEGDSVEIKSEDADEIDGVYIVEKITEGNLLIVNLSDASNFFKALYSVMGGTAQHANIQANKFNISRSVPQMDYVIECNNRIWGCRYGKNNDGEFVNEIYACKQGDFRNWNYFAGTSIDSYAASCGTSGKFTGAVNFNGRPLFFKQNHYWLVSGDYPAQYGYTDAPIVGVQDGSANSLVTVNRLAYYLAPDGIRVFDGYNSTLISSVLGGQRYQNAAAGTVNDKYYIAMHELETNYDYTFVYDTLRGLWHKERWMCVYSFLTDGCRLYWVSMDAGYHINCTENERQSAADRDPEPETVAWYGETGDLLPTLQHKYLKQMSVRMNVPDGASVRFLLQYDASGKWEEVYKHNATKQRFVTVPIRPRRCDHLRLRIEGEGDVEIYAINKTYEQGSDV